MLRTLLILTTSLFWATMWLLLIRAEKQPEGAAWRAVSVEHVLKRVFQQRTDSDLFIRSGGARLGHLRLSPRIGNSGRHHLDFSGNLRLQLPNASPQRITWEGAVEFDAQFQFEGLRISFSVRDHFERGAGEPDVQVTVEARHQRATLRWPTGEGVREETIPLDEVGLTQVLRAMGLDPSLLGHAALSRAAQPQIVAEQSYLTVQGERLETWRIAVRQQNQTWLEMHFSQLGQLLQAKTIVGWTLDRE
jgi:hypothetical protein